jgi:hypothetical protein
VEKERVKETQSRDKSFSATNAVDVYIQGSSGTLVRGSAQEMFDCTSNMASTSNIFHNSDTYALLYPVN